jgi:predicted secreted protein/putative hemolysin
MSCKPLLGITAENFHTKQAFYPPGPHLIHMTSGQRKERAGPGLIALGLILVLFACLAGCTQQTAAPAATPAATSPPQAGMANPASLYCGEAGGTLAIEKDAAGGEYGMCTFPNGTSCEEWALFRGEGCKAGVTAVTTTAAGKQMVTFTEADNGSTHDIMKGTKFAVVLAENPTTGYQWNATLSPGLGIVSDNYQADAHAEGMVGVGGTRTWIVLAKDSGAQEFSAVYGRSWEPVTGDETGFVLNINVTTL